MKKITIMILVTAALLAGILAGCGTERTPESETKFSMYYLNEEQNELETETYTPSGSETAPLIDELIARQGKGTDDGKLFSLLPKGVTITGSRLEGTTLTLDFSEEYYSMLVGREALVRGGLVREFLQVDGVDRVVFTVNGIMLTDSYGREIGPMTNRSFVENSAESINAYQSVTMTLYFTDSAGTKLIPETRKVYYISSEPLERAVLEELFKGPRMAGSFAAFGTEFNILSVVTQDGTCYVNLDSNSVGTALTPNVQEEVQIYAIVNSLADTCGVQSVQITLDGESNRMFRDSVSLSQSFTKDDRLTE